jgi:hypothetical protein
MSTSTIITEVMLATTRPVFSGHETFQCRHLWLKKGYDFVNAGKVFSAEDAVVELGVGKNMVTSIRFWMRAFDLMEANDQKPNEFADYLLGDHGKDPYLEDDASLWLLHHRLVRKGYATSYNLIFNELRKERMEFSKNAFVKFVQLKSDSVSNFTFNKNTIESDFEVFVKLYLGTDSSGKDKEEIVSGIFPELNLVWKIEREKSATLYHIETNGKEQLPDEVLLFALLDDPSIGMSVSLDALERDYNSVGSIFAINRSGLVSKIESLCKDNSFLIYKDDAGIRELQFKSKPNPYKILDRYYNGY